MYTLCIRYAIDPNRLWHFRSYVDKPTRNSAIINMERSVLERCDDKAD